VLVSSVHQESSVARLVTVLLVDDTTPAFWIRHLEEAHIVIVVGPPQDCESLGEVEIVEHLEAPFPLGQVDE